MSLSGFVKYLVSGSLNHGGNTPPCSFHAMCVSRLRQNLSQSAVSKPSNDHYHTHTHTPPLRLEPLGSWLKRSGFLLRCSTSSPDGSTFWKLTHLSKAQAFKAFHGNMWHHHFKAWLLAVTYRHVRTCTPFYGTDTKVQSTLNSIHVASRDQRTAQFVYKVLNTYVTTINKYNLRKEDLEKQKLFHSYSEY